jgi:hypothetical protein
MEGSFTAEAQRSLRFRREESGKWESGRAGQWENRRVGEWESGRVGEKTKRRQKILSLFMPHLPLSLFFPSSSLSSLRNLCVLCASAVKANVLNNLFKA